MKKSFVFLFLATAVLSAGCQREAESPDSALKEIKFKASLAFDTKVTATSFEEGDEIGLSAGNPLAVSRAILTYSGGMLAPNEPLYWPISMPYLSEASFIAWYPFDIFGGTDPFNNTVRMVIGRDQYRNGAYESSDLLSAVASASPAQETVNLEFHHMFSRMKITVEDNLTTDSFRDVQADSFRSIGIRGLKCEAGVNVAEGTIVAGASSEDNIYPMKASAKNYWALVVPQTGTPEIVITLNSGKTLTYVSSAPITFRSGKQISATLTLKDDVVSFQWEICEWEDDDTVVSFVQPQPDDEIWYTTVDGVAVPAHESADFGAAILYNSYINGKGIIKFDGSVTKIGGWAFDGKTTLTAVYLPASVTSIESAAFQGCTQLKTVVIPDGVTIIKSAAFNNCSKLSEIALPNSLVTIEGGAFSHCSSITSLAFPDSFENLDTDMVFGYCTRLERFEGKFASQDGRCLIMDGMVRSFAPAGLTEYTVPDGVRGIAESAFYGCGNLTSLILPDTVTEIGNYAFCGCSSLPSLAIPDGVVSVGQSAFSHTYRLERFTGALATEDGRGLVIDHQLVGFARYGLSSWSIPEGITSLLGSVFFYCSNLTSIEIPESLTSIGTQAFGRCTSLGSIAIPDQVTSIGAKAFYYCTGLSSVTIPQNVENIGHYAFYGADAISEFYVLPTVPPVIGDNIITSSEYSIYVPAASVDAYKEASRWKDMAGHIQAIPTVQPQNEIWYTSTDGNIVAPNNAADFGAAIISNTYSDGKGVITFDGPVVQIGWAAFSECSTLSSILLPNSVSEISGMAFYNCGIEEITIPASVSVVDNMAFSRNPWKGSMKAFYGKGATEDHAFLVFDGELVAATRTDEVIDCVIPSGVQKISDLVFGSSYFRSLTIPDSVTEIQLHGRSMRYLSALYGKYATQDHRCLVKDGKLIFFAPIGLESYTLTEPVTSIGTYAFYNQYGDMEALVLPETVTTLDYCAFGLCYIKNIVLPSSLKTIGDEVFWASYGLETVSIPAGVESIGSEVFAYAGVGHLGEDKLQKMTFWPLVPPTIQADTFEGLQYDGPFYVPAQSVEDYKNAQYWSAFADRFQAIEE